MKVPRPPPPAPELLSATTFNAVIGTNKLKDTLAGILLDQKVIQLERQVEIKKHPVA